jgi:UDP-2,3-diacylglucosamine pyrophosphatase LpxH
MKYATIVEQEYHRMVHEFDKLYAVSDLHIGGPPGRAAFRETQALAWLITQAGADTAGRVAFLLNGDIFDFLADADIAKEFNAAPDALMTALQGSDQGFAPIFDALRSYVANPNRFLVLQIGNHDIELALPNAQAALRRMIDPSNNAFDRIVFESSGAGWTSRVCNQVVLALHGNASDPWNEVDYLALERFARALEANQPTGPAPQTNAGTTLVIHVLNDIKKNFPFVDLLKPEGAPLMAVLDAVDAQRSTMGLLKALKLRAGKGDWPELLRAGDDHPVSGTDGPGSQMLDFLSGAEVPRSSPLEALRRAEKNYSDRVAPRDLVTRDDEKLGSLKDFGRAKLQRLQASLGRLRGVPDDKALRIALRKWLAKDDTFDVGAMSDIDVRIARSASRGVDVLLAGHTHLPREVHDMRVMAPGPRVYLNTGTWMRVLNLKGTGYLESDAEFAHLMQAFRLNDLQAIDDLGIDPRSRPVAVVDKSGASIQSVISAGALFHLKPMKAS